MYGFSKKHFKIYHTASIAIVVVYTFVISEIDLFHIEECHFGTTAKDNTDFISHNDLCPACKFLNNSNSTEVNYNWALVISDIRIIPLPLPRFTIVVNHDEWACSISLRAPPSITIS